MKINGINGSYYANKKPKVLFGASPVYFVPTPKNEVAIANSQPDKFIPTDKKNNVKKILAWTSATIAFGGAVAVALNSKNISKFVSARLDISRLKKLTAEFDEKFPQDAKYRQRIMKMLSIPEQDAYKFFPVAGTQEFRATIKEFSSHPEVYNPGVKKYDKTGKLISCGRENLDNYVFGANLHMHTVNSDGRYTVQQLLDDVASYADEKFAKTGKRFLLAITDHDTLSGIKEAVHIISRNPKKYQNLRLVLGIENTTMLYNPQYLKESAQVHVLSYGIDPYAEDIGQFINPRVSKNVLAIKDALNNANHLISDLTSRYNFQYEIDDFLRLSKSYGVSVKSATYPIKDYLQFKLLFMATVKRNEKLIAELEKLGVNHRIMDYSKAVELIPSNLDYSQGQKYVDYYYKALQEYVYNVAKEQNPNLEKTEITKFFKPIDSMTHMKTILNGIEEKALNPKSEIYVPPIVYPDFSHTIRSLSLCRDGLIGIAHPGVLFPNGVVKDNSKLSDLYKCIFADFKRLGGEKAAFAEGHYQIYYNDDKRKYVDKLADVAEEFGLLKTGGIDTHGTKFYSS